MSGTSLSVAIGRDEHAVVVVLAGDLGGSAVGELGRLLEDLIDGQGNLEVVVDARGLDYADVVGADVLAAAGERARRRGAGFTVVGADSLHDAVVEADVAAPRRPQTGELTELEVCVDCAAVDDRVGVKLSGEIDVATVGDLRTRLENLVDAGRREFVVDLAEVSFMDSTGIATFAWLHQRLREAGGGQVTLQSPRRSVYKILELTGLSRVVPVVRT
jgi:anti-sigma B factor antagonist